MRKICRGLWKQHAHHNRKYRNPNHITDLGMRVEMLHHTFIKNNQHIDQQRDVSVQTVSSTSTFFVSHLHGLHQYLNIIVLTETWKAGSRDRGKDIEGFALLTRVLVVIYIGISTQGKPKACWDGRWGPGTSQHLRFLQHQTRLLPVIDEDSTATIFPRERSPYCHIWAEDGEPIY